VLWQDVSADAFAFSELNASPIGSGPFKVASISRTASGIPSSYKLKPFIHYTLGKPYLNSIKMRFYQSEQTLIDALKNGDIDAAGGISPALLEQVQKNNVESTPLNLVFGVFFNQNQSSVLRDKDVRTALDKAIDRNELIQQVFYGYATALNEPLPNIMEKQNLTEKTPSSELVLEAQKELIEKGWMLTDGVLTKTTGSGKNAKSVELAFTLSTGNVPELRAAAEYVRSIWSTMGARIEVQIFDQGDLSQNVIRARKYDALLFGEIIGRELDLYAFWHSSQRNDPGLNIALYANTVADSLLGEIRTTSDTIKRMRLYTQFIAEINKDVPAIFLYAPDFVYIIPNDIKGFTLGSIETPSDRFLSAALWHRQTDYVWPLFKDDSQ
jgi:peptide/nickel transport system substrate-binding protein